MFPIKIDKGGIDGLSVKFESEFIFDTWKEVYAFVKKVDEIYCKSR